MRSGIFTYVSRVNGIVHNIDPTLEGRNLEKTQVCIAHMVKVHVWVVPRQIVCIALLLVLDYAIVWS